jgi:hypothetical protein
MKNLTAIGGLIALLAVSAGCSSDRAGTELDEANVKLNSVSKELDDTREQLAKTKEQLAKADSINATAAGKISDLPKQLDEAKAQLANEVRARRLAERQITVERDAAEEKSRALLVENRELKDRLAKIMLEKPVAQIPADAPIPKNVRLATQYPVRMASKTEPPVPLIYLDETELEMGAIGKLRINQFYPYLRVDEVLDKEKMIVVPILDDRHEGNRLLIEGVPTGRYASGTQITELPQSLEIARTERVGSSTLFVASVIDDATLQAKLKSFYNRLRDEKRKPK